MKDKELIRTEIERLKHSTPNAYDRGRFMLLSEIEDFIDSLPEEPVSEDLEEAAKKYVALKEYPCFDSPIKDFKAGANWQKEQMMRDAVYAAVHEGLYMDVRYI